MQAAPLPAADPSPVKLYDVKENYPQGYDYQLTARVKRPRVVKICSIAGGGTRGIIGARLLETIEKINGRPAADQFDIFAGASIGGLIATLLNKAIPGTKNVPQYPAAQFVEMFLTKAQDIFPHKCILEKPLELFDPEYNRKPLHNIVTEYCQGMLFKDVIKPTFIPTSEVTTGKPWLFSKTGVITDPKYTVISPEEFNTLQSLDVIECTTAAPTYFPSKQLKLGSKTYQCVDGGTWSNNPAQMVFNEAQVLWGTNNKCLIGSFGTGECPQGLPGSKAHDAGLLFWGENIPDGLLDWTADSIDLQMRRLFPGKGQDQSYFFFQPEISVAESKLDEGAVAHMKRLLEQTDNYIEDNIDEINTFCDKLDKEFEPDEYLVPKEH